MIINSFNTMNRLGKNGDQMKVVELVYNRV